MPVKIAVLAQKTVSSVVSVRPSGLRLEVFTWARISLPFVDKEGLARRSHNTATSSNVSLINPVHAVVHSSAFHFNIILACTPRCYTWSLSLRFSHYHLHICYMHCQLSLRNLCVQQYKPCSLSPAVPSHCLPLRPQSAPQPRLNTSRSQVKKFSARCEPHGSLPPLQESATCTSPEPVQSRPFLYPTYRRSILLLSTHLLLGLVSGLLPSSFPVTSLYAPLPSPSDYTASRLSRWNYS